MYKGFGFLYRLDVFKHSTEYVGILCNAGFLILPVNIFFMKTFSTFTEFRIIRDVKPKSYSLKLNSFFLSTKYIIKKIIFFNILNSLYPKVGNILDNLQKGIFIWFNAFQNVAEIDYLKDATSNKQIYFSYFIRLVCMAT